MVTVSPMSGDLVGRSLFLRQSRRRGAFNRLARERVLAKTDGTYGTNATYVTH